MIEELHNYFRKIHMIFNNFVLILPIPIIFLLSIGSGYTTFHGMKIYVNSWIAGIITFAVQAIIVIVSIELSKSYLRANIIRYIALIASLVIVLAVSIFFSYFTFFERFEAINIKERRFYQISTLINDYVENIGIKKGSITNLLKKKDIRYRDKI